VRAELPVTDRRDSATPGAIQVTRPGWPGRGRVSGRPYDLAMQLTAAITHEGDWFVARCLEVEVTSQGKSIDEALENLKEALELYFEDQPEPASFENPVVTTFQLSA